MEGQSTNTPALENCCICFYPLMTEICQLDCKHMYHFACLTEWQQNKKTQNIICPICQQNTVVNTIFDLPNNHDNNHNDNHPINEYSSSMGECNTENTQIQQSYVYPILKHNGKALSNTCSIEQNPQQWNQQRYRRPRDDESYDCCICCTLL